MTQLTYEICQLGNVISTAEGELGCARPTQSPEMGDVVGVLLTPMRTSRADHLSLEPEFPCAKQRDKQMLCGKVAGMSEVINAGAGAQSQL